MPLPNFLDEASIRSELALSLVSHGIAALRAEDLCSLGERVSFDWDQPTRHRFRYQQVGDLLDQAADLLDRGVRDRDSWDDLHEKWFNAKLALEEFAARSRVNDDEDEAGKHAVEASLAAAEAAASTVQDKLGEAVVAQFKTFLDRDYSDGARGTLENAEGDLARWSVISTGNEGKVSFEHGYPNNPKKSLEDLIWRFATQLSRRRFDLEKAALEVQQASLAADRATNQERLQALASKAEYALRDVEFKKRLREIERRVNSARVLASTAPGGALDYARRMKPYQDRFENDFREARYRLRVAREGLLALYGYDEPLPQCSAETRHRFHDDCVIWVRRAISFVVQFERLDQRFATTLSLKALLGPGAWASGLAKGTWSFSFPEALLPCASALRNVRLRGIHAFVESSAGDASWALVVSAPKVSVVVHRDTGKKPRLDQSNISRAFSGRVRSRACLLPPDVVGSAEFHNVSPYSSDDSGDNGMWTVTLAERSAEQHPRSSVEDVQLDLLLVAQM